MLAMQNDITCIRKLSTTYATYAQYRYSKLISFRQPENSENCDI